MIAESTKSDRGNNDCNSVNDENRNTLSKGKKIQLIKL